MTSHQAAVRARRAIRRARFLRQYDRITAAYLVQEARRYWRIHRQARKAPK